jgi:hypothetical protein
MRRTRLPAISRLIATGSVAAIAFAACGTSTAANRASRATSSPSTFPDGMTAAQMAHMRPAVIPPHPLAVLANGTFDPAKVSLAGVAGVTAQQQHSAEALLRETLKVLPHWTNTATAAAEGFHPIGDALTGDEHWIHWDWIEDHTWLDPHRPEALVYHVDQATQKRTLEAVMFILPKQFTFNNLPDIGGKLVQFHIHDNLCFTNTMPAPQVAGFPNAQGKCLPPLVKFHDNVMMHVWIRPNPCGPFAALEGVGAGQVKPGQTRACDQMHGATL